MKKIVLLLGVVLVAAGCVVVGLATHRHTRKPKPVWAQSALLPKRVDHSVGGSVKVVVSTPPEIADIGDGGVALRALVWPSLFAAQPDGTWAPSLVQPGSDGASKDALTAWFKLRPDVTWSDGTPISVADLDRTADKRFVKSVSGPDKSGQIVVNLRSPLPGWRMLWSGANAISPPKAGLTAGPFDVQSIVSGADTVLVRNNSWFAPAFLNSVELDYVPDATMARQLLGANIVDVEAPVADTVRTQHFEALSGTKIVSSNQGGRWVALQYNSTVANSTNADVLAAFPRPIFVNSLLDGEAVLLNGFVSDDNTWNGYGGRVGQNLNAVNQTVTVPAEEPLSDLISSSLQRAVTAGGGQMQVRSTDFGTISNLIKASTYDVALVSGTNGPDTCWTCIFGSIDGPLASQADAGDRSAALQLEKEVKDDGVWLPLWQQKTEVVYRPSVVSGVAANGYDGAVTWNAANWYQP